MRSGKSSVIKPRRTSRGIIKHQREIRQREKFMSQSAWEVEVVQKLRSAKDMYNKAIGHAQRRMEDYNSIAPFFSRKTRNAFRGVHMSPPGQLRAIAAARVANTPGGDAGRAAKPRAGMLARSWELIRDLREVPLSRTTALRILIAGSGGGERSFRRESERYSTLNPNTSGAQRR